MKTCKSIFFSFIILILSILLCECILSFFTIDIWFLKKILFYQADDLEVHKVSNNSERVYELRPGTSVQYDHLIHPQETKYSTRSVTINSLGFRGGERQKNKDKNVFRIIIVGGSNTYGAAVSDDDTYPAQMQKIFDEKYPGKIEVWNGGICAYVLSQKVSYAEYILEMFDPDLFIFQHNNLGRRAFLLNMDMNNLIALFNQNKKLYIENIPFLLFNKSMSVHNFLVYYSRFYRIFFICLNSMVNTYERTYPSWSPYADMYSTHRFDVFLKKHTDIPVILFDPIENGNRCEKLKRKIKEDIPCFFLDTEEKADEYADVHPPSYVYEWYAEELCNFLIENDYILL